MKRCLGLLAVCSIVAACGSSARVVSHRPPPHHPLVPPSPTALRFSADSNRAYAEQDALKVLQDVDLPASTTHVREVPKDAPAWFRRLAKPSARRGRYSSGIVVVKRIWTVPDEPFARVKRFFRAHEHSRPRTTMGYPWVPPSAPFCCLHPQPYYLIRVPEDVRTLSPIPGRSSSRTLSLWLTALPHGATAILGQVNEEWIQPPSRAAVLDANVSRINISSVFPRTKPSVRVHVRTAYDVGSIVSWLNGLGTTSSGSICLDGYWGYYPGYGGYFGGPRVTLTFRSTSGAVLARAQVQAAGTGVLGACNPIALTVGHRRVVYLLGGDLLQRIDELLGVNLTPPNVRDIAYCLNDSGWGAHATRHGLRVRNGGRTWTITLHATGKLTLNRDGPRRLRRCLHRPPLIIPTFYKSVGWG